MCQGVTAPFGDGVTVMLVLPPVSFRGKENDRMGAHQIHPGVWYFPSDVRLMAFRDCPRSGSFDRFDALG